MSNQRLLLLQTHSGLHAGQPQAPDRLSRDPETGRPFLRPAALLGALRKQMRDQLYARYRDQADWKQAAGQDPDLQTLFGSLPRNPDEPGPALDASPVQLLLLPVRSLQGVSAWVCSPGLLTSVVASLASLDLAPLPELPQLHPFDAMCREDNVCLLEGQHLLLEELSFNRRGDLQTLLDWLTQSGLLGAQAFAGELAQRLILISDTAFDHFMRYAMVPLVRSAEHGPDRGARLQHVEMLPPDTWLYSLLSLDPLHSWDEHASRIPGHAYLGSHRSTGHGFCALSLVQPGQAAVAQPAAPAAEVAAEAPADIASEAEAAPADAAPAADAVDATPAADAAPDAAPDASAEASSESNPEPNSESNPESSQEAV